MAKWGFFFHAFPLLKKCPFTQIHLPYRSVIYKMVYKTQIIPILAFHNYKINVAWFIKGVQCGFEVRKVLNIHRWRKHTSVTNMQFPFFFFVEYNLWIAFISFSLKKNLFLYLKVVTFPPKWNYTWLSSTIHGIRSGELST